ncbi:uncharacterized protein LOC111163245 [Delphinapterus leucas]|uniref:Uncharacterized protein LOC111163245 n=1 Tax=Delphinapterus leucas TaxID=9749 RepID=A0A7F8KIC5_DELLE|nr:uncharacterized protein LOC111163245 [Delphinapterus leucas]
MTSPYYIQNHLLMCKSPYSILETALRGGHSGKIISILQGRVPFKEPTRRRRRPEVLKPGLAAAVAVAAVAASAHAPSPARPGRSPPARPTETGGRARRGRGAPASAGASPRPVRAAAAAGERADVAAPRGGGGTLPLGPPEQPGRPQRGRPRRSGPDPGRERPGAGEPGVGGPRSPGPRGPEVLGRGTWRGRSDSGLGGPNAQDPGEGSGDPGIMNWRSRPEIRVLMRSSWKNPATDFKLPT